MSDRPMIFSAPMVRALLAGRKTQTRRLLKPQPTELHAEAWEYRGARWTGVPGAYCSTSGPSVRDVLRWRVGDRIWVKEAHYITDDGENEFPVYAADEMKVREHLADVERMRVDPRLAAVVSSHAKLRSPLYLPRWASRAFGVITEVRVQRVREISSADAEAEGIFSLDKIGDNPAADCWTWQRDAYRYATPIDAYCALWLSLHGDGDASWRRNPFVAALSFAVALRNIDDTNTKGEAA